MNDVDRARAALTDELNILAGLYHVGRGQLEAVRAAADRYALAAFDLGVSTAWMEPVDRDAERARLEASHAD
jgi:hypothetical protein